MPQEYSQISFSRIVVILITFAAVVNAFGLTPINADTTRASQTFAADYDELHKANTEVDSAAAPTETNHDGWWRDLVARPLRDSGSIELGLEQVILDAVENSKQIRVFSEIPLIRETTITEADSAFDWTTFVDTRWDDTSLPIGSTLTAGPGIRRFRDHNLSASAGFRRRTTTGGQFEVSQRLGFQDNNSLFFVPNPQGTSQISLSFSQPILRGRGKVYNTSFTLLAQIDKSVADSEFQRQLESHLLEVTRAYWSLYMERAVLYQKLNSYLRGKRIYSVLDKRRNLDASEQQFVSAKATLRQRESELQRARAAVKNAESRLRSLVNCPHYLGAELLPTDCPVFVLVPAAADEAFALAVQYRPEVHQAIQKVKAAGVRLNMSKNELLPILNLVTETYVSGLEPEGEALEAWKRQFDEGEPSYGIGLQYEMPVWNRAAKARQQRRRLELRQLENQYSLTLENIQLEVEIAVRELETSQQELSTKKSVMKSRQMQLDVSKRRWQELPGEDLSSSLALENLLLIQDRLLESEFGYLQSQLTYNLALMNLKKATGLLLQQEGIGIGRGCICQLPTTIVDKEVVESQ